MCGVEYTERILMGEERWGEGGGGGGGERRKQ